MPWEDSTAHCLQRAVCSIIRGEEPRVVPAPMTIVVGVSGGADSTALLRAFVELRQQCSLSLYAVHLNYGLRGAESDGDQDFVEEMTRSLEVSLDVVSISANQRCSQAHARDLRRQALFRRAHELRGSIALGHTRDDNVEGFLLALMRGAGLEGLGGMSCLSREGILRPLIGMSRDVVRAWLKSRQMAWREDSSNSTGKYVRNQVRYRLVPQLEEIRPGASSAILRAQSLLEQDGRYFRELVDDYIETMVRREPDDGLSVSLCSLKSLHPALRSRIVRRCLVLVGGDDSSISHTATREVLAMIDSSVPHQWTRRLPIVMTGAGRLWFHPHAPRSYRIRVPPAGKVAIQGWKFEVMTKTLQQSMGELDILASCCLSVADLRQPLIIRNVSAHDVVSLRGRTKGRTIISLLKQQHVPIPLRRRWPLVADGRGVLWIPLVGFTSIPAPIVYGDIVWIVTWGGEKHVRQRGDCAGEEEGIRGSQNLHQL